MLNKNFFLSEKFKVTELISFFEKRNMQSKASHFKAAINKKNIENMLCCDDKGYVEVKIVKNYLAIWGISQIFMSIESEITTYVFDRRISY